MFVPGFPKLAIHVAVLTASALLVFYELLYCQMSSLANYTYSPCQSCDFSSVVSYTQAPLTLEVKLCVLQGLQMHKEGNEGCLRVIIYIAK